MVSCVISFLLASNQRHIAQCNYLHGYCRIGRTVPSHLLSIQRPPCKLYFAFFASNFYLVVDFVYKVNIHFSYIYIFRIYIQSPHKYAIMVILGAVLLKIPRFFHFQLNEEGSDYATSPLMENTAYIWANAYWDDLMITGFIPLLILIYFNLRIYLRVSYHYIKNISALSIETVIS